MPAFARLHEAGEDVAQQFVNALKLVSRITFPVCLFLGALATPLITTVYGAKWSTAADALVGLAILGAARTIMELFSDYLVALKRTKALLLTQVIWLPSLSLALIIFVKPDGIAGAGLAHAIVATLIVIPTFIHLVGRAGVPTSLVARALIPSLIWALATAAVAGFVASQIGPPLLACVLGGAAGLAIYLLPHLKELRRLVESELNRRRSHRRTVIDDRSAVIEAVG